MLRPSGDEANAIPSLPPVNWIRSRTIDVQACAIDLRFDWDKEQAIGSTTVTLAPFTDTDTFTLDAAAMTIESVTLAGGEPLKFNYDGKKDNDNLEIMLDRVYTSGEDIKVKIDYTTNYVNKADARHRYRQFWPRAAFYQAVRRRSEQAAADLVAGRERI